MLAGVGALTLAIVQVHFMSRGSKDHKKLGWVWAALMAFLATWAARTHRVVLHRNAMIALYVMLIAAVAALVAVPGRLFNQWFLG